MNIAPTDADRRAAWCDGFMSTAVDRPRPPLALLGFLLATFVVAALGGLATAGNVDGWYASADKPPFNPPNWLFGPVWTVLYIAMAVAAWLVWRTADSPTRTRFLQVWWVQLAFNLAWTPTFFAAELLWPAVGVIVVLDVLVALTIVLAWRVSRVAGSLLLPYLAWVLFATALNVSLAVLN